MRAARCLRASLHAGISMQLPKTRLQVHTATGGPASAVRHGSVRPHSRSPPAAADDEARCGCGANCVLGRNRLGCAPNWPLPSRRRPRPPPPARFMAASRFTLDNPPTLPCPVHLQLQRRRRRPASRPLRTRAGRPSCRVRPLNAPLARRRPCMRCRRRCTAAHARPRGCQTRAPPRLPLVPRRPRRDAGQRGRRVQRGPV